jgi:hypothetical protein
MRRLDVLNRRRRRVAKTKIVHAPPVTPAAGPRLFAQLATAVGELLAVAIGVVGIVTIVGWVVTAHDASIRARQAQAPPFERVDRIDRSVWRCWWDDRYRARLCEQVPTWAAPRRYPARWEGGI